MANVRCFFARLLASFDARRGNWFASLELGILFVLLILGTAVYAQCPTNGDDPVPIPGEGYPYYNTATDWVIGTPIHYNILGTDCWIDIQICQREIDALAGGLPYPVEEQYYISGVTVSDYSGCDGLDFTAIINDAVEGVFQSIQANCYCPNTCEKLYAVIRQSCWSFHSYPDHAGLVPCSPSTYCSKKCYVCFSNADYTIHETGCVNTMLGLPNSCAKPAEHWEPQVCYAVPCPE